MSEKKIRGDATADADPLIDRLYDVATDPSRYEALLDHWEEMISPQRAVANDGSRPEQRLRRDLRRFEGHFERADRMLDRIIRDNPRGGPEALLDGVDTAAFVADRSLSIAAINAAGARGFGVTRGARIADLALAPGEAEALSARIARLLIGNSDAPAMVRTRGARVDRIILVHLRPVRPAPDEAFVVAVTSEMGWPDGFGDLLRAAFDLTQAEADILRSLAEGFGTSEIATARGRSVETVRAQIKSIMAKTETRRQTELVRLTLSTIEMAQYTDAASEGIAEHSDGFGTLAPRPFQTLMLPDGRRFDYLILGDPDGRPCLFLPQDYGLVRWPAEAEAAAAERRIKVIVPIRPGYGSSTPLPRGAPYIAQICEDIRRLLDHLGAVRVPVLSLGDDSYTAIALHATIPERIAALICCAGVLPLTRPEQYQRMDKWHRFILAGARYTPHLLPFMVKAGFALARRLGKRGFIHAVYGKSAADIATFEIPEVFEAMVCGSEVALSDTHSAHDAFTREVIANETTDWTDEVAALRGSVPVHFLNGLQDPQVPPETLAEHRSDYDWIDFRVFPDAGQLLFFLKWRDALDLVETYMPGRP